MTPRHLKIPDALTELYADETIAEVVAMDRQRYKPAEIARMVLHDEDDVEVILEAMRLAQFMAVPYHEFPILELPDWMPSPEEIAAEVAVVRKRRLEELRKSDPDARNRVPLEVGLKRRGRKGKWLYEME